MSDIVEPAPRHATARVSTAHASKYLQQLCKHFAHKIPATCSETTGQIDFSIGRCVLAAGDGVLVLTLTSPDDDRLTELQDVVWRHLVRFAFREDLAATWSRD